MIVYKPYNIKVSWIKFVCDRNKSINKNKINKSNNKNNKTINKMPRF